MQNEDGLLDRLRTEADLCRNETATDIANLLDEAAVEMQRLQSGLAGIDGIAKRRAAEIERLRAALFYDRAVAIAKQLNEELLLLRRYANAAHWWVEAHDRELAEEGDTREAARERMLDAEAPLIRNGYIFEVPNAQAEVRQ